MERTRCTCSLLGCFALAGYAALRLFDARPVAVAVWFIAAVIGHDLLLFPLYAIADRSAQVVARHRAPPMPPIPWINYLQVPVLLSGLLLVGFPLIFRLPEGFSLVTALPLQPYLYRWLLITGVLFVGSAIAFAIGLRRRPSTARSARHGGRPASSQQASRSQHQRKQRGAEQGASTVAHRISRRSKTTRNATGDRATAATKRRRERLAARRAPTPVEPTTSRLYDIDLLVRRSIVYGSVSLLSVGLYFGVVTITGHLLPRPSCWVPPRWPSRSRRCAALWGG